MNSDMSQLAWIGLGGNEGDVASTLTRAVQSISTHSEDEPLVSRVYVSPPWGGIEQPNFLNQVVGVRPLYGPEETLRILLDLERGLGRDRRGVERWGPRTIDLDLLSWPNRIMQTEDLVLPHPRLHQRRFVLQPWCDLAPNLVPFGHQKTVKELLEICKDDSFIWPYSV